VSRKTVHGAFSRLRARLGGSDLAQKDALPLSGDGLPHRGLETPAGIDGMRVTVDCIERPDQTIPLVDDRKEHQAEVGNSPRERLKETADY
jgi:hypothetical protein